MVKDKRNPAAEAWYASAGRFAPEAARLRMILLAAKLEETIRFGMPCYAAEGRHVIGVVAFPRHFGLWFFQGAMLDDPAGVLVEPEDSAMSGLRQWRMSSSKEIDARTIGAYVRAAKANAERTVRQNTPPADATREQFLP